MKLKVGNVELKNNIILAPMAGITNLAYRKMLKSFGCGLVVSEMISDFALIYGNKETLKMIESCEEESPLAIQLFGGSKDSLIRGAKILLEKGNFEILDINLGCPVPKVVKENAGSSWLKEERQEELYDSIISIVEISSKPVSVKIRLGWDESSINVVNTCKLLEKAGVAMITIHGRTRSQYYLGKADYEYIRLAKEAVKIPIIANGDIDSLEKAIEVLEYTKADGLMLGRGALGNPKLVTQIVEYLETGNIVKKPIKEEQIEYLQRHFDELYALKGEHKAFSEMRGLSSHYLKGMPGMKQFKVKFTQMKSKEEFYQIIDEIKKQRDIL